mgnify:CR=1 FL=1
MKNINWEKLIVWIIILGITYVIWYNIIGWFIRWI